MLLLAWLVVVGLSWVDWLDSYDLIGGLSADIQQATETDLDEVRDHGATIRLVEAYAIEAAAVHPSLSA